jgi:proline dehydrogenase
MKTNIPHYQFVKRASKRFMPGEKVEDALKASESFSELVIGNVFTYLGENINNLNEAEAVTDEYLNLLDQINQSGNNIEISLKLTHIGFDFSFDKTLDNFIKIAASAKKLGNFVWIDMEQSSYVDRTIEFYRKVYEQYENTGLCLQAYLFRTKKDVESLIDISPNIRLVKGAYMEAPDVAFPRKADVDLNFFELMKYLLKNNTGKRNAAATHDTGMISRLEAFINAQKIDKTNLEFHMLYGIKSSEQIRLVNAGFRTIVLISYGDAWYPWYVRRLAERPANVGFVLKNMFTN